MNLKSWQTTEKDLIDKKRAIEEFSLKKKVKDKRCKNNTTNIVAIKLHSGYMKTKHAVGYSALSFFVSAGLCKASGLTRLSGVAGLLLMKGGDCTDVSEANARKEDGNNGDAG